ncbi:MAG: 4a-hydroxytetrahydrobiopterin dehydratase [Patescibacteria group bacterium]
MKYFEEQENYLVANFEFENFDRAINFITQVALLCNTHNHHPDIGVYDYKWVNITSTTHSARHTITQKDKNLAQDIEDLYESQ